MLSDCEGDELKDDQLFSFAAEIHIELVTLVCDKTASFFNIWVQSGAWAIQGTPSKPSGKASVPLNRECLLNESFSGWSLLITNK